MKKIKCTNCGKELLVNDDVFVAFCNDCVSEYKKENNWFSYSLITDSKKKTNVVSIETSMGDKKGEDLLKSIIGICAIIKNKV